MTVNENGVVLRVDAPRFNIYIESTVFTKISSPSYQGTLYIGNCNTVITKVCAFNCTLNQGHLLYGTSLSGKICIQSYVSMGSFYGSSTSSPIFLYQGQNKIEYSNSSNHNIMYSSVFSVQAPESFTVEFNSFLKNTASSYYCLNFVSTPQNTSLKQSNIINNTHQNSAASYGVIQTNSMIEISNCYFSGNLYYLFVGPMYLLGNFIKHPSYISNGAIVTISPNGVNDGTYPFNCMNKDACMISTFSIRHFASAFCETPIHPITPTSSIDQQCLPCPTDLPAPTPAQTIPPSCNPYSNSQSGYLILSNIFHLIIVSLVASGFN